MKKVWKNLENSLVFFEKMQYNKRIIVKNEGKNQRDDFCHMYISFYGAPVDLSTGVFFAERNPRLCRGVYKKFYFCLEKKNLQ
jgi:hypothetical protein